MTRTATDHPLLALTLLATTSLACGSVTVADSPDAAPPVADAAPPIADAEPPDAPLADAEPPPAPLLLEDLEDGDTQIIGVGGQPGGWYTYADETATLDPSPFAATPGGANSSLYAAQLASTGATSFGAGLGFNLQVEGQQLIGFDASRYTGVEFDARGNISVAVTLRQENLVPLASLGTCQVGCEDFWGRSLALTEVWQRYQIPFSTMTQAGFSMVSTPLDLTNLFSVQFQANGTDDFEIAVDNIGFY